MDYQVTSFSRYTEEVLYQNRHYIDWDKTEFLKPLNMDFQTGKTIRNPKLLKTFHIMTLGIFKILKFKQDFMFGFGIIIGGILSIILTNLSFASGLFGVVLFSICCYFGANGIYKISLSQNSQKVLDFLDILLGSFKYDSSLKEYPDAVLIYLLNHEPHCNIIQNIYHSSIHDENKLKELFILNFQNMVNEESHNIVNYYQNQCRDKSQSLASLDDKIGILLGLMESGEHEQDIITNKEKFLSHTKKLSEQDIQSINHRLDNLIREACNASNGISYQKVNSFFHQQTLTCKSK